MTTDEKINYSLLDRDAPINVLAVEDDEFAMNFLEAQISGLGHSVLKASDGQKALSIMNEKKNDIDVVLMDRLMPVMDGLTAVRRMKDDRALRNIPVVMVTGADRPNEMKEGLDAGVFYYLTKPVEEEMLRSVLSAAVREAQQTKTLAEELAQHRTSFHLIDTAKFNFQTLNEARSLAAFIANCFPDPNRVLPGLGELLINAVEHGNLEIGYNHKTELINQGTWESEINRLQKLPEHAHKFATATIVHKVDGTYVVIEDQGTGFDWKKFLQIDPARAGHNHGRGIAQAYTMSFDKLKYNKIGNQVVAFVGVGRALEW